MKCPETARSVGRLGTFRNSERSGEVGWSEKFVL